MLIIQLMFLESRTDGKGLQGNPSGRVLTILSDDCILRLNQDGSIRLGGTRHSSGMCDIPMVIRGWNSASLAKPNRCDRPSGFWMKRKELRNRHDNSCCKKTGVILFPPPRPSLFLNSPFHLLRFLFRFHFRIPPPIFMRARVTVLPVWLLA